MGKENNDNRKRSNKVSVFLGGTCQGYDWRRKLEKMLSSDVYYFDPYLRNGEEWNDEAKQRERIERKTCDFCLYVITSACVKIPYSIAEVVDDSNKRPYNTILFIDKDGFDEKSLHSAEEIENLCKRNGAFVFNSLDEVANFLNDK